MSGIKNRNKNDLILIKKIKENACENSLLELIKRHSGICIRVIQRYSTALTNQGFDVQDVYCDQNFIIYKAALTYNFDKEMKVSSWIGTYTRYYCLTLLSKGNHLIPLEENWSSKQILAPTNYTLDYIFNILSSLKDPRIKEIFTLRYFGANKKLSWNKIGKQLDLSNQTVINLHKKGVKLLKRKLNSTEIFDNI